MDGSSVPQTTRESLERRAGLIFIGRRRDFLHNDYRLATNFRWLSEGLARHAEIDCR